MTHNYGIYTTRRPQSIMVYNMPVTGSCLSNVVRSSYVAKAHSEAGSLARETASSTHSINDTNEEEII